MKRKLLIILLVLTYSISNGQAAIAMDPELCNGDVGTVEIVSCCINYDTYQWYNSLSSSGSFEPIIGATQPIFVYDWATYNNNYIKVFVTKNTISYFSDIIYLNSDDCNLNIKENTNDSLTMVPNPVENIFTLTGNYKFDQIQIYNSLGKQVFDSNQSSTIVQIDMSSFSDGIYFLTAKSGEKIQKIKFLKR